eukprot:CAMPEP_0170492862 /NCGR_PEP_ID=MMETSP0208-20121228/12995_1 /TAXON_ID=197538 /ORGANISM="Strombidium inclinatum, Strain S3" /LENGTH=96 /DNA_ID=CAMNT_0010768683 /DNA_START=505 /DNA_END=795 /DNA_ORIENTATION=-
MKTPKLSAKPMLRAFTEDCLKQVLHVLFPDGYDSEKKEPFEFFFKKVEKRLFDLKKNYPLAGQWEFKHEKQNVRDIVSDSDLYQRIKDLSLVDLAQ